METLIPLRVYSFDEEKALAFIENAKYAKVIALDTETTGLEVRDGTDHLMGISLSYRLGPSSTLNNYNMYFPIRHNVGHNYTPAVKYALKNLVETADVIWVMHNAKFDIVSLSTVGIAMPSGKWLCTQMMAHLINENWPASKSLDSLATTYLKSKIRKAMPDAVKKYIEAYGWGAVPSELLGDYASVDSEITLELYYVLIKLFQREGLQDFWKHKARLIEVVIEMEKEGVRIDVEAVKELISIANTRIESITKELGGYSPSSNTDLKILFLKVLGLPVVKETPKGEPSFDKEAMALYDEILEQSDNSTARLIQEARGWKHSRGLFFEPYLRLLSPDGRLRPRYVHHKDPDDGGTVTGRMSCRDPNLQQIPRQSDLEWKGSIKKCFIARPGFSLWGIDYSQLELRLGTAYSREPSLIKAFEEDRDVFTDMADQMGWLRQKLKGFVYATQYGAGARRISHIFSVTESAASALIDEFYSKYPRLRQIIKKVSSKVHQEKKLKIWSGRYRHFRDPRGEAHKGFNSLIQGGAADIVERVMVHVFDHIVKNNPDIFMLLQIHDEVVYEIRNGAEEELLPILTSTMADIIAIAGVDFGVKFKVEAKRFGGQCAVVG